MSRDQVTTDPSARIKALEEAVDDEGVLAEACERAVRDCHPELARKIHVGLFNMIGRHMAHHLKDVRKEFAERAALTQQSEGGAS